MRRFALLVAAFLAVSLALAGCGSRLPLQENADRVLLVDETYGWLLTGETAQDFLRLLRSAEAGRVKDPPLLTNYSVRLVIADGFGGPGQVILYDAAHKLISYKGLTYRLSQELPRPQPQDGVHFFAVGSYGLNALANAWVAVKAKDKGAVIGLDGLYAGAKVLLVSMGEQTTAGYTVDLMNAHYDQGTWRLLLEYRRLPEDAATDGVRPIPTFVATFDGTEKVEVYEVGEAGGQPKLVGMPIEEEKVQPPKPPNVVELTGICRNLIDEYLRDLKSAAVDESRRLIDYRIDTVKFEYEWPATGRLTFYVEFSVLPANKSGWMAGNGQEGPDGWILKKTFFVDMEGAGTDYHITGMGTSP